MRRALSALLFSSVLWACACTQPKADLDPPLAEETGSAPSGMPALATSCQSGALVCAAGSSPGGGSDAGTARSCCDTLWVPGGPFMPGFSPRELPEGQELPPQEAERSLRLSGFFLDRFEITRGRFLRFAQAYPPELADGAGAHPKLEGSGWQPAWAESLPASRAELLRPASCGVSSQPSLAATLADAGDPEEGGQDFAMGCLSWDVAFAFCAWDGGRLPTELEWEFAAAGGAANRPYPWGDNTALAASLSRAEPGPVGSNPDTRGRYGHDDLAGGVQEWALDWFSKEPPRCDDCANLSPELGRVIRGGKDSSCCAGFDSEFHAAARDDGASGLALPAYGARCARDAPLP